MTERVSGKAILGAQSIVKSFGAQPILDDVSLTIHEGDRIGLIGVNGSGKSTLMKIMAGLESPDDGLVTRAQGLRVALLSQQCALPLDQTVGEALREAGSELRDLLADYEAMMHELGTTGKETRRRSQLEAELAHRQHQLELADAWNLDQDIKKVTVALNLPTEERQLQTLSGGELRRVDLAVQLIRRPDVLLLDEPTNQIDTRSVEWIEEFLESYPGSCVLVTHDRYFLDRVVNRIVELEFNRLYSYPGKYGAFLDYKLRVKEAEMNAERRRQSIMRRELEWLSRGPKARGTKQQARKKRFDDLDEQGPPREHKEVHFEIPESRRLGKRILEAQSVGFSYGGESLVDNLSLLMHKHMRVGVVGPNGCGKTTLLKLLMGELPCDSGSINRGDNTEFLYVDQTHGDIDPEQTILRHVSNGQMYWEVGEKRIYVPAYLENLLFDKASVHMPMKNLSGGERNRIDLARKLLRGGNFLVLDEPTNDLDLQTLRVLEEAILDFDGCALVVSHDRYFLNRLCTDMLIFEGEGRIIHIAGNYDDYLLYRQKMEAERAAARPVTTSRTPSKTDNLKSRRLSYNEKRELAAMEDTILEAEAGVVDLEQKVLEPDFYQQPHEKTRAVLEELDNARARVEELYRRWEELERIASETR